MLIDDLIDKLGYAESPNFVQGDDLGQAADYAHIFRRAQERINLRGVYVLRQPATKDSYRKALVPIVCVCKADDESQAQEFRRLAWNQNAAPFLIVTTPSRIRLFSSFNYEHGAPSDRSSGPSKGILDRGMAFDEIASLLGVLTSQSIDDGTIWREYGHFVTPKMRVDWSLLDALKKLDDVLINDGLEWGTSHALIGKYVYLWYLRQREILSDKRLDELGIKAEDVFDRNAKLSVFKTLLDKLDDWLNGAVFPMDWSRAAAPRQKHLRKVAGVFCGDNLNGQLYLPFDAYDFSIIPVETLSAIYEQFLHAHEPKQERSRGKELGAYYTPIPLVNLMLDELDDRRPLKEGMTCFDASCGSGAFLVQCYRRLIENRISQDGQAIRRPAELRELLTTHIFGLDRDGDACQVAELSLILTLLDYVQPPDLLPVHNFPKLRDNNIFEADFFDPDSTWAEKMLVEQRRYDWVVGNPPWVELKPLIGDEQEIAKDKNRHARKWIQENKQEKPTGGDQLAEAFLWKVVDTLKGKGVAAMLVPAMTLFKTESHDLRKRFFTENDVWCVANFANLAYVLFPGRAETPAAALFYSPKAPHTKPCPRPDIPCYSPLVASQAANRPQRERVKKDTWSLAINATDVRPVTWEDAASGDRLVWKTAMWGSRLDLDLLRSVSRRFEGLHNILTHSGMHMSQGSELRERVISDNESSARNDDSLTFKRELVGKYEIDSSELRRCGRVYTFPKGSLVRIEPSRAFLRKRGGEKGLAVSAPPHIIVDSSRRFAIYSDDFIVVRPRQIGIAGSPEQADLLKAISLFLVSDFVMYHEFLTSPQFGVYKSIADLNNLKGLPVPIDEICRRGLGRWAKLHAALVTASALNGMVNEAIGLREFEQWLVSDLVHVRMKLIKGKIDRVATGPASPKDMLDYARILKQELDSFIEVATDERHTIEVCQERQSAMIAIHRGPARPLRDSIRIIAAEGKEARTLRDIRKKVLRKHSQWLYFERALTGYANGSTYLFKPMQRLHWLKSQALVDAAEIIADRAGGEGR